MSSPVMVVAWHEFLIHRRNRWVVSFAGMFAALTLAIAYFGMVTSGYAGFQDFTRTAASLINAGGFLLPLFALIRSLASIGWLADRPEIAPPDLAEEMIAKARAQAATVSVGIRASMDRAVAENASTVLDGVAIVPGMIDLGAYEDVADVIFLVVATLDIDAYARRFAARAEGDSIEKVIDALTARTLGVAEAA